MRLRALDFLRGLAIILVLFRHSETRGYLYKIGWVGVDLFFVLSGFLVSGLIFREYLSTNKINIKKFLIRRGLKIYPAFYFFIIVSILVEYFLNNSFYKWKIILAEVFFLQSYCWSMWIHTWSISVEEHFYFALSLFAFLVFKFRKLRSKPLILFSLFFLLFLIFIMRFIVSWQHKDETLFGILQTHLRMDGILSGVLISYLFYFTNFFMFFKRNIVVISAIGICFLFPIFIFDGGSFFMNSIGISMLNISFSILLLFALYLSEIQVEPRNIVFKFIRGIICFVGVNSYSIYLWHLMAKKITDNFILSSNISLLFYSVLAIIFGVTMSYVIEKPFLKIREIYFQNKTPN